MRLRTRIALWLDPTLGGEDGGIIWRQGPPGPPGPTGEPGISALTFDHYMAEKMREFHGSALALDIVATALSKKYDKLLGEIAALRAKLEEI